MEGVKGGYRLLGKTKDFLLFYKKLLTYCKTTFSVALENWFKTGLDPVWISLLFVLLHHVGLTGGRCKRVDR